MANWCSTSYVFFSKTEEPIKKLYNAVRSATSPDRTDNRTSDFKADWLGNILIDHGFDWKKIRCRGSVTYIREPDSNGDYYFFELSEEGAWCPQSEVFENVLTLPEYDGIQFVYMAEESGCEVYINTDTSGLFFPEKYYCEVFTDDEDFIGSEYFEMKKDLNKYIKEMKKNYRGCDVHVHTFENHA